MEEIQANGNYHVRIYEQGNSFTPYGKGILHADVNGLANIIRKYKPDAFARKDISYLYGSIDTLTFQDLYKDKKVV